MNDNHEMYIKSFKSILVFSVHVTAGTKQSTPGSSCLEGNCRRARAESPDTTVFCLFF